MSVYDHLPRLKTSRETSWYNSIPREEDEALDEGLRLLESLRSALPPHKSHAVDEAKKLLREAAHFYNRARSATEQMHEGTGDVLNDLLTPQKRRMLEQLCALLRDG